MNYKLVAVDCDNTLLNSEGYITDENKETIQYLKSKGVEFIVATGRNDILAADYVEELEINAPIIGCNGASIRNLKENKTLSYTPIPKQSVKDVFGYLSKNNIPFRAFSMKKGYSNDKKSIDEILKQLLVKYTKILKTTMPYEYVEDPSVLAEKEELVKIVVVNNDPEYIKKYQSEIKAISGIDICRSARNCLDIIASGVSKGNALKTYADILKIDKSEIISFGDSENDLSMIQYAGIGVAMENGEESLKSASDMITLTNDESGVSKALKKIFKDLF